MSPLFQPDEIVSSPRLRTGPLTPEDIDGLGWLEAALSPDWTIADLNAQVAAGHGVCVRDHAGAVVGVAAVVLDQPAPGDAVVPFLAIDPDRRFRGLGGEAGLHLEQHLRELHGIARCFAPVPDGRGLAVYFWLRLGYRPLTAVESPGRLIGLSERALPGIWMVRERA